MPRSGLVAVLFTDLVGSTELMSQLGDRAFDELRRRHFAVLVRAVATHEGEEVKNTGDGLMTVFSSAADAVEAAVAMQQATARHASTTPLAIRVSVAVGDATVENGDYFGTPVVEAARLVAAARPGQVLTTQITRALAGARCTVTFTDQDPLELKGLPEPVAVCEVAWEPVGSSVPMPALLTDVGRIFVGRDTELEQLSQVWKEASAGEQRVVFLAGEPGVGKTPLAAEVATRVHEEGGTVLAGRCDEDLGVPYQPFVEALRHYVDHTPLVDLREGLGRYGGELARLVPELTGRVSNLPPLLNSDPETERYRLFDAVAAWLSAVSAGEPLLLVLDELQWAAKPTVLLLRHVLRFSELKRLLVLGTYRDTELGHDHPLVEVMADLRRDGDIERVALTGFDSSGVAAFMEQAAGRALDDDDLILARAISDETEGNPFFVREVLRHLAETGAIERRAGRWGAHLPVEELGIPEGIREVVGRRLGRLSEPANRTLHVAAVIGPHFELPVLKQAMDIDEADLLSALEQSTEARLVLEVAGSASRFRFAHALVRDTLYGGLSAARRVTVHRRVAEAIEAVHGLAVDDQLPALAHHWARASASATQQEKAVDYTTRAGDRALSQLAHDEAVAYYRHALDLLDVAEASNQDRHVELLISLGEAQRRAGDPGHRENLLTAAHLARERGDTVALTRAALANTRGILFSAVGSVDRERVAVLEAALSAVRDIDAGLRARLLATLGLELLYLGDRNRRVELSDEALGLARIVGDPATLALVLLTRFYTIVLPSTLGERLANSAELVAAADRLGDPVTQCRAALVRFRAAVEAGDMGEADRCLEVSDRLASGLGQKTLQWILAYSRGGRALLGGDLGSAERFAVEARELGVATGQPETELFTAATLFGIRFEQGNVEQVLQTWVEMQSSYPALRVGMAILGLLYTETGRDVEASRCFEELAASDFGRVPPDNLWLQAMCHCATICSHLGDQTRARLLTTLLTPYSDQIAGTPVAWFGSVAHHLALLAGTLGHWDQAEGHFAAAEQIHARIGSNTWLARTRLEWARLLLTRRESGDIEGARRLLGEALATAREFGQGSVERRAVALLGELP